MKAMIIAATILTYSAVILSAQSGIRLNELMASNQSTITDNAGEYSDWVELINTSSVSVDLAGYFLTDNADDPRKWQFPSGQPQLTTLDPGAFALIWASGNPSAGAMHTSFKLAIDGEYLALVAPDGVTVVDELTFGAQQSDVTFGRFPDGEGNWRFLATVTPGAANSNSAAIAAPEFSHMPGAYDDPLQLTISVADAGMRIYYSLDGSEPGSAQHLYSEPLLIDKTTVVRAVAVDHVGMAGDMVSGVFFIDEPRDLPLLALITDPKNLWDAETGIYQNFNESGSAWERPAVFQYSPASSVGFVERCGIRIQGETSVWKFKKSFRAFFRDAYGAGRLMAPQLIPSAGVESFKKIVLRAGYDDDLTNDFGALLRDQLGAELWMDRGWIASQGDHGILYLNDSYWGIYNVRENIDENFIADHFPYNDFDVIRFTREGPELRHGALDDWNAVHALILENDLADDRAYQEVAQQIDIDNLQELLALAYGIHSLGWGWNSFAFKSREPGAKWKFLPWDFDGAFKRRNENPLTSIWHQEWWNAFARNLLASREFRDGFINRSADLLNSTLTPGHIIYKLDSLAAAIDPAIEAEIARWTDPPIDWEERLQFIRDYASEHHEQHWGYIAETFDLAGVANIRIESSDERGGTVSVNSLRIGNFPWDGTYFQDVPITLIAEPAPGYVFAGWSEDALPDDPEISVALDGDLVVTARFIPVASVRKSRIIAPALAYRSMPLPVVVRVYDGADAIHQYLRTDFELKHGGGIDLDSVRIKKGVGTLLTKVAAGKDFTLRPADETYGVGGVHVRILGDPDPTPAPEMIQGEQAVWPGEAFYRISGDMRIAADASLTIQAGAIVLLGDKSNILADGSLTVEGTQERPVLFIAEDPEAPWGGIELENTAGAFRYAFFVNGGADDTKQFGHSESQPVIFGKDAVIDMRQCFIMHNPGKAFGGLRSRISIDSCVVSNCDTGGEAVECVTHINNSFFKDMPNDDGLFVDDDNDGIYIKDVMPGSDEWSTIENTVVMSVKDDCIDHSAGLLAIRNCWLEDAIHEGVAGSNDNTAYVFNTVVKDCDQGIEAGGGELEVIVDHCVVVGCNAGLSFGDSYFSFMIGSMTVANSIFYDNKDNIRNFSRRDDGPIEGAIRISYSITNDEVYDDSSGCFAGAPLFAKGLELRPHSIGVDAGIGGSAMGLVAEGRTEECAIVINEIAYAAADGAGDWMELHNRCIFEQDLSGWYFTDSDPQHRFTFPEGTILPAFGYLAVARDAAALRSAIPAAGTIIGDFDFGLGEIDALYVYNADDELIDMTSYTHREPWPRASAVTDGSLELRSVWADNNVATAWRPTFTPGGTPGLPNSTPVYAAPSSTVINEIGFYPLQGYDSGDWLEVYNATDTDIDVSGWFFVHDDDGERLELPPATSIEPHGYLLIVQNREAFVAQWPDRHNIVQLPRFRLEDTGQLISFCRPDGIVADSVRYGITAPWPELPQERDKTLELLAPYHDNSIAGNWAYAIRGGGTPGAKNSVDVADVSDDAFGMSNRDFNPIRAYPNPFDNSVEISYALSQPSQVELLAFDSRGALVQRVFEGFQTKGSHTVEWTPQVITSGAYFLELYINGEWVGARQASYIAK